MGINRVEVKGQKIELSDLVWRKARFKPVEVKVVRIFQPFTVYTIDGVKSGGPGDYLISGPYGELFPVKAETFHEAFELLAREEVCDESDGV